MNLVSLEGVLKGRTKTCWAACIDGEMTQILLKLEGNFDKFNDLENEWKDVTSGWPIHNW